MLKNNFGERLTFTDEQQIELKLVVYQEKLAVHLMYIFICNQKSYLNFMDKGSTNKSLAKNELIFQIILHLMVFYFLTIDNVRGKVVYELGWFQLASFGNYILANVLISYFLLPNYFYKKKYLQFAISFLFIVLAVIFIEEFFLDKIFFPETRIADFKGVVLSLGESLSVLVTFCGMKIAWDSVNRQKELDQLKIMVKESELSYLNSQINPHFLFNNLNNLYSYAVEQSSKTPEIILGLSGVLRYMLYECREKTVPLLSEIEHLKNFIQLYELQIEERGTVEFKTGNITDHFQIAPLILNVFVENAFKHSQTGQSEEIQISVFIKVNSTGELEFTCINNFEESNIEGNQAHGIGLENVKKRLKLLYPNKHELVITKEASIYTVILKIKLLES